MTVSMVLGYTHCADETALQTTLTNYTCPNDGFVHAVQDQYDTTLVYLEPACPVDAVASAMAPVISSLVTQYYNETDAMTNPYERVLAIEQSVRTSLADWLTTHTRDDIANFLNQEVPLRKRIVAEMVTQGILA